MFDIDADGLMVRWSDGQMDNTGQQPATQRWMRTWPRWGMLLLASARSHAFRGCNMQPIERRGSVISRSGLLSRDSVLVLLLVRWYYDSTTVLGTGDWGLGSTKPRTTTIILAPWNMVHVQRSSAPGQPATVGYDCIDIQDIPIGIVLPCERLSQIYIHRARSLC
jgi:hypothetical protein